MVNSSGEVSKTTQGDVGRQIPQLRRLSIADLKVRYRELLGEEAHVLHKQFLIRRIAWQLQARALGDLSERARQRIAEIADGDELSAPSRQGPKHRLGCTSAKQLQLNLPRDPRLPPPGGVLRREYQGREITVKVLEDGFEWESQRYSSLSALARELTGTRWNGLLFFRLTERHHG
jgi:hypothetical protein